MQCSQRSVDLASCCLYLYLVTTITTEVFINYFPILFSVNYDIAPDKDWRQLGIYPPLFGLNGYFKF